MTKTVLLTGFEPFNGAAINPSWEAARALDGWSGPGFTVVARQLPCVFGGANLALLEAIDADVIKTYVELGMGIGIIAGMAFDPERDRNLRAIPVGHLFGMNVSRVAVKQGAYLRSYIYTFIELLAPTLNRKMVESAMRGTSDNYEL